MEMMRNYRLGLNVLALAAAGGLLAGCIGGPTYGTDKTQTEQLVDDLGNAISLPTNKAAGIEYEPRPGIVRPPKGAVATLPPPQESVASAENPRWPESPEEVRKRLVAEVDESNVGKSVKTGQSPRMINGGRPVDSNEQVEEFRRALAIQEGKYTGRRYLSDPPPEFRQPAPTAPVGDLGTPEKQKERERLAAAKKNKSGGWWPW
jgi:hypothetical protein